MNYSGNNMSVVVTGQRSGIRSQPFFDMDYGKMILEPQCAVTLISPCGGDHMILQYFKPMMLVQSANELTVFVNQIVLIKPV